MNSIIKSIILALCGIAVGALLIIYGQQTVEQIFALIIVYFAIQQFCNLAEARRDDTVGFAYWIMPSLLLIAGVIALLRKEWVPIPTLTYVGVCMIFYGITEFINAQKVHDCRKQAERRAAEAKAAEEAALKAQQEGSKADNTKKEDTQQESKETVITAPVDEEF
jgi:hypothetical protein